MRWNAGVRHWQHPGDTQWQSHYNIQYLPKARCPYSRPSYPWPAGASSNGNDWRRYIISGTAATGLRVRVCVPCVSTTQRRRSTTLVLDYQRSAPNNAQCHTHTLLFTVPTGMAWPSTYTKPPTTDPCAGNTSHSSKYWMDWTTLILHQWVRPANQYTDQPWCPLVDSSSTDWPLWVPSHNKHSGCRLCVV